MIRTILGLFVLLLFGHPLASVQASERPNVLIIYADDLGTMDLGCLGQDNLQTPNLDRLAAGGLLLTQMYAPAPVCSASRVGLLTGRFPVRAGQPGNGALNAEEVTIAETFAAAGYRTGQVGKWHLGHSDSQNPGGQGFDDWFGHLGGCIDNYSHFFYWNGPNRHDLFENGNEVFRGGEYFPDLMQQRCRSFIDAKDDRPWLLYWAFNSPHYPYQGTKRWLQHYASTPTPRREYSAFLSTMDETIGKVLGHLDASGQADSTIVIFQADHGHSTETRAFGGGGDAGVYRGAKFSLFEGGIRVPSIVRYPKKFPAGEKRDQFLTGCDWLPTLSQLCDVPLPTDTNDRKVNLDGDSVVDVLSKNVPGKSPQFYWHFGAGKHPQWAIRSGPWKLIGHPRDTSAAQKEWVDGGRLPTERWLSNLDVDPSEATNLAASHPEQVRRLEKIAEQYRSQW